MKRNLFFCVILSCLLSCSGDGVKRGASIKGSSYKQVSYEVAVALDLNNDGAFSTNLLDEKGAVLNPQKITFKENGTVIPPYPISTCVEDQNNGDVDEFMCLVVTNYYTPPSYTQNETTVTIDADVIGELSTNLDTLRFQEILNRDSLNKYPSEDFEDQIAISTYLRE